MPGYSDQNQKNTIDQDESVKELFRQNEIQANKLVMLTMLLLTVGFVVAWVLNMMGVFVLERRSFTIFVIVTAICFGIAILVNWRFRGDHPKTKYYLMGTLIIVCALLDALLSYNIVLFIAFPLLLSLRYYSEKYTIWITIVSMIAFSASAAAGSWFQFGLLDLNFVDVANDTLVSRGEDLYSAIGASGGVVQSEYFFFYMTQALVPKLLQYAVFGVIAYLIAKCGKNMVIKQAIISAEASRIESELSVARDIQANMLPTTFPAFPNRSEFDVFATMTPAKEVGGDFYDFFMVDERHVAVVIADVSGKGVPAALFMAIAKAMIKDHTGPEGQLDQTFSKVNNLLCESNSEGLFVTAFEGVLDLVTGEFIFVNAGHEVPYICRNGKTFELYKLRPGFVLAGMEDMRYRTASVTFEPGDKLFQYTDGVTEATNAEYELYDQDRLTAVLKKNASKSPTELLPLVRADIDAFVGKAPQFDDITMLCIEFKKNMEPGDSERETGE